MTPAEMRELLAKATPGPWAYECHGRDGWYAVGVLAEPGTEKFLTGQQETGYADVVERVALEIELGADAALIAALRNEAPALLDRVEALERGIRELCDRYEQIPWTGIPTAEARALLRDGEGR